MGVALADLVPDHATAPVIKRPLWHYPPASGMMRPPDGQGYNRKGQKMTAATPSLAPTTMIDADHPAVIAFARSAIGDAADERTRAIRLYLAVRDGIRYDPYQVDLSAEGLSASRALENGFGWCIPKAVLLAAACRAVGIPAQVGFANVQNHLSTQRLREILGTDTYYYHGYTTVLIDGKWVKATPAFNIELCEKMKIGALEFDGKTDSILQPYSPDGARHMEYLTMHGEFDDVPRDDIVAAFATHYPNFKVLGTADWEADVANERAPA